MKNFLMMYKMIKTKKTKIFPIILFFIFLSQLSSCKNQKNDLIEIKLVLLNPERFYGKVVTIQGKKEGVGENDVMFNLTDNTGMVTVTTEKIPYQLNCLDGSSLIVVGRLKQIENRNYFSAESILSCR
ncbi:MAG: hypothetical protein K2X39_08525 [Silvanigrellaceae bacterium]|nr:hypothetical protein [Silvanigrellaceae bacterium]